MSHYWGIYLGACFESICSGWGSGWRCRVAIGEDWSCWVPKVEKEGSRSVPSTIYFSRLSDSSSWIKRSVSCFRKTGTKVYNVSYGTRIFLFESLGLILCLPILFFGATEGDSCILVGRGGCLLFFGVARESVKLKLTLLLVLPVESWLGFSLFLD